MTQSSPAGPTITVTAAGSAAVPADQVQVHLAVEVLRPDPGAAFTTAGNTVTRVLAILADRGVDSRHVRTAALRLGPRTVWRDNEEILLGHTAGQDVVATVVGLDQLPLVLSDIATGGLEGVRIDRVELSSSDPSAAVRQARVAAMQQARTAAQHYAELAGVTLGAVVEVTELPADSGPVPLKALRADMPVSPGEDLVVVHLRVRFG